MKRARPSLVVHHDPIVAPLAPPPPPEPMPAVPVPQRGYRSGLRGVTFWLEPATFKLLKARALEQEETIQSLMVRLVDAEVSRRGSE